MGPPPVVGPDSTPYRVRIVQRLLNAAGAQLRVDGAWGPATTRAVEAVQRRAGLPVDGRVGPTTAAALSS
jgi:peptidoglycan hydrolase-like protein with peptidoglycan-binding domain